MTFTQYLQRVSIGGLLAVLVLMPLMPRVLGEVWRIQRDVPATCQLEPLAHPVFAMVQGLTKTGILRALSQNLYQSFGVHLLVVGLVMLAGIGTASSLLANIPVVAASILIVKGYFVTAELVPEGALGTLFTDWQASTVPVFVAMMFGATSGGNATLIGAAANVVGAGICAAHGKPLSFTTFLRYGVPLTLCQLVVSALYVLVLPYIIGR
jgi:Na+/H+ antiporter NhaD/arsenite permease-like protein